MPEIVDNVIPYIGGEEEKSEREPLKLWGHIEGDQIVNAEKPVITAQCFRCLLYTSRHRAGRLRNGLSRRVIFNRCLPCCICCIQACFCSIDG